MAGIFFLKQVKQSFAFFLFLLLSGALLLGPACGKKNEDPQKTETHEQSTSERATESATENLDTNTYSQGAVESTELAENEGVEAEEATWNQHLLHYTQGWIPAASSIKLRFSHEVSISTEPKNPLEDLLTFKPDIEAEIIFSARDELTITPTKRLAPGQILAITLKPKNLEGIPDDIEPFRFQVQALKQDYELQVDGLVPSSQKNKMRLSGTIKTSDTAESSAIESSLQLVLEDKTLELNWAHNENELQHIFSVDNIPRSDKPATLKLSYSSKALGIDKFGSKEIEIPALNQFKITAARATQRPQQYAEVSFSEALDRNQNLNGLVSLNGETASVRVDGANLRIYPTKALSGTVSLKIEDTIRSSKNIQLAQTFEQEITFISELPGVRFASKGSIIPPGEDLFIPIEAINVNSIWITAFKIFDENIPGYLQNYQLTSSYRDDRSGRYLWRKKINLPEVPFDNWQRFDIDLKELMDKHANSIVHLQINIDKSNIAYSCAEDSNEITEAKLKSYNGPNIDTVVQRPQWFNRYYSQNNGYVTYEQRRDPCHLNYYTYYRSKNVRDVRNFIVSDIGLIVKKGASNKLHVTTTSIQSGQALPKAKLKLFNYQHQLLATSKSDKQGMSTLDPAAPGFYLIAEYKKDKNYIRFPRNEALPSSQFDTRGETISKGIKGFIYGERDVWRPGDDIFLNFILEDKDNVIPDSHPVSLDFFDPRGSKITTLSSTQAIGEIYSFHLNTKEDAPTGNWRAVIRVGGEYFDKTLKIETITPNRLKVELTPAQRPLRTSKQSLRTELYAQWLNGATAKNLKADSEIKLRPMTTSFNGYSQYKFDDPASNFRQFRQKVFDGKLDPQGRAAFNLNLSTVKQAPGKLRATFITRVFEQSGNFSTSIRNEDVMPFDQWVGINVPDGSGYRGAIARNKDHQIEFISIDSDGKPLAQRKLSLSVYHIGWRWWWDQSEEDLSNYVRRANNNNLANETLVTDQHGKANWTIAKDTYSWGRHLIRICDEQSGHCSGKDVYLGWSWNNQVNPDSATQLMLASDKESYQPGDTARISIPELAEGKILYSLENGSKVLEQKWLKLKRGARYFDVPITGDMAPNVYLNAVLLLPHHKRESDAPIRLYGITPLIVNNPDLTLEPQLEVPKSVRPESSFEIAVSETNGKQMHYTLAVVDEGLLGITGYEAPNPYYSFNKREALGVLTWDMFDGVLGAYGAKLEHLLKIGGGDKGKDSKKDKERRFPPVVKYLGAFTLEPGKSKTHQVSLPQYMGAVRVMLVAANNGAYGKAEQSLTVTQPLTLLATLPRVLGPKENISLPVNVFVNNDTIKNVQVKVIANDIFKINKAEHTFTFNGPGDQIESLELEVLDRIGKGEIRVSAQAGEEKAEQTIFIQARSPNIASTKAESALLQPGETWAPELQAHGIDGTNQSAIVVSSFPPMNLERRLNYLIRYPHGCVEQTTSAIFPQINLHKLTELSTQQKEDVEKHVHAAIDKYRNFQNNNGGFTYWPGTDYVNDWSSVYVTHFLVSAKEQGYAVPNNLLTNALNYLKGINQDPAQNYARLLSAYRLFVLARADAADLSAMNRLREQLLKRREHYNDEVARWKLAIAYQYLGLSEIAKELLDAQNNQVETYRFAHYTYGSSLRDQAILLFAYHSLKMEKESWESASEIAKLLAKDSWYSTHSTSWALLALADYAQKRLSGEGNRFAISDNEENTWQALESIKPLYKQVIKSSVLDDSSLRVRNDSAHPLHIEVSNTGVPSISEERASAEGLKLTVEFFDIEGKPLDVSKLPQGQDFIAELTVDALDKRNSWKMEDIAQTLRVPSGWQIRNERLEGDSLADGLDYQDIRDDAVLSYFSLWKNHYWHYRYNDQNRNSQTIRVKLNASFAGKFYLPGWQVKSMYEESISAQTAGQWVEVVANKE